MMIAIKAIAALALLAVSLPATAGKLTVHNQGHYLVAFQVSDQDSGVFPIGQSRTMENVSGTLTLSYRNFFAWRTYSSFYSAGVRTFLDVKPDGNIEVTFTGDLFNPRIKINNLYCEIVSYLLLQCS